MRWLFLHVYLSRLKSRCKSTHRWWHLPWWQLRGCRCRVISHEPCEVYSSFILSHNTLHFFSVYLLCAHPFSIPWLLQCGTAWMKRPHLCQWHISHQHPPVLFLQRCYFMFFSFLLFLKSPGLLCFPCFTNNLGGLAVISHIAFLLEIFRFLCWGTKIYLPSLLSANTMGLHICCAWGDSALCSPSMAKTRNTTNSH